MKVSIALLFVLAERCLAATAPDLPPHLGAEDYSCTCDVHQCPMNADACNQMCPNGKGNFVQTIGVNPDDSEKLTEKRYCVCPGKEVAEENAECMEKFTAWAPDHWVSNCEAERIHSSDICGTFCNKIYKGGAHSFGEYNGQNYCDCNFSHEVSVSFCGESPNDHSNSSAGSSASTTILLSSIVSLGVWALGM